MTDPTLPSADALMNATVASGVVINGNVVQAGQIHGGVTVQAASHTRYHLGAWPERRPMRDAAHQPGRLLAVQYAVVPFDTERRREQVDLLTSWRDAGPCGRPGVSVMLLHGPAGQGKTRLAGHVAALSGSVGWSVLTAEHGAGSGRPAGHGHGHGHDQVGQTDRGEKTGDRQTQGLFVVVDYAERWPTADLLSLISDLSQAGSPVRLLLLARPAGLWWSALAHELHTRDIPTQIAALPPLAIKTTDRQAVFVAAHDAFAAVLGVSDPHEIEPPAELAGEGFRPVLTVHMAALVAVHEQYLCQQAHTDNGARPHSGRSPAELAAYLLDRERAHWHRLHISGVIGTRPDTMAAATYLATLTRAVPYLDGLEVLTRAGVASTVESARAVLADHAYCFPPAAGAGTVLEPLYPDRLAEDFLALQTPLSPEAGPDVLYEDAANPWIASGYQADPWADSVLPRLLAPDEATPDRPPGWTRTAIIMLIETARRWPHMARQRLYPLLRAHPELAVVAGSAALSALAGLDQDSNTDTGILEVLAAVESALPAERHIDLDVGAVEVTQRLVDHRLAMSTDAAETAVLCLALGSRCGYAGLYRQSVVYTGQGIALLIELVKADPSAYMPDLALALSNISLAFGEIGKYEAGLAAITEAVRIRRRLADQHPADALPSLAISLSNLAVASSAMGQQAEALAAASEAEQIRRALIEQHHDGVPHDLTNSLINLAVQLNELGRWDESLTASTEAVEYYRPLATQHPETFLPDLAAGLVNQSVSMCALDQRKVGLAAITEAVECYRRLADQRPELYLPDLAAALTNLSQTLGELGSRDKALDAVIEAVQIRRRLAEQNPVVHLPELANSLNTLSVWAGSLRQREESFAAVTEAVQIHRRLAHQNPDLHLRGLADSLTNFSVCLAEMDRWNDGLAAITEAVQIRRRLAEQHPDSHLPDLADGLHNLAVWFDERGQRDESLAAAAESVQIRSHLAEQHPSAHAWKLQQTRRLLVELRTRRPGPPPRR